MSTFKKAKVILLPTGFIARRNEIGLQAYKTNLRIINNTEEENLIFYQQHLYIISNEEIKEKDWVMYTKGLKIQFKQLFDKGDIELANIKDSGVKKIIATTNKTLSQTSRTEIPQPSQQFIQKFIKEYNKGNVITDVLVEYTFNDFKFMATLCTTKEKEYILKINPKDNTITIKKVKDNWNREEVIKLLRDAHLDIVDGNYSKGLNKWIEENL